MAAATCELKWLKVLLLSLEVHNPKAMKLYCDSLISPFHVPTVQLANIFTKALGHN